MTVRTRALANLALVKYFGKRDTALNLPAAGSLSLTLEPLETRTELALDPDLRQDLVEIDGVAAPEHFAARVRRFLDLARDLAGGGARARVSTTNSFPTGAGLASSASGFAALALAATRAYGLETDEAAISALARRGSGSAARSVTGGVSVWCRGAREDGADSFARTLVAPGQWDLRVVVGVTDPGPKTIGSTDAMERTRVTSPYYAPWVRAAEQDLIEAERAVRDRDLAALGAVTERSALAMHAAAIAARPGIVFWNGATIEGYHLVRRLRERDGLDAYFTCDAGPQPKVLCGPEYESDVVRALGELSGVTRVIPCRLGGPARLIE